MKKLFRKVKILKISLDEYTDDGSVLCEIENNIQILAFCENLYEYEKILKPHNIYSAYFYAFSKLTPSDLNKQNILLNKYNGLVSASGLIKSFYDNYPVIDIGFPVIINIEADKNEIDFNKYYKIDSGLRISFENLLGAS